MKFFTKKRIILTSVIVFFLLLVLSLFGTEEENEVQTVSSNNTESYEEKNEEKSETAINENYVVSSSDEIQLDVPEPNPASDFMYQLTEDGNGVLITAYIGTSTTISIPSEIEELPVTNINSLLSSSLNSYEEEEFRNRIRQVFFPDSVKKINEYLFSRYKNLYYVRLSKSCSIIPSGMFEDCESLKYIQIPECVTTIGDSAFKGTGFTSMTIPKTVTIFGKSIFSWCEKLENIELPDNMNSIPSDMFSLCESLKSIEIPENVKNLGDSSLYGCKNIAEIQLPKNLERIGEQCFYNCEKIESIEIPDTVTEIGSAAFGGTGITKLIIPESVNTEKVHYNNKYFSINFINGMEKLEVLRIPNSIKKIEDPDYRIEFFPPEVKRTLRSVNLPESLKLIEGDIFKNMNSLTELIIPDSLNGNIFGINAGVTFNGTTKLPLKTQKRLKELGYRGNFVSVKQ